MGGNIINFFIQYYHSTTESIGFYKRESHNHVISVKEKKQKSSGRLMIDGIGTVIPYSDCNTGYWTGPVCCL